MSLTAEQAARRLNTLSSLVVGGLVALSVFGFTVMLALLWLAFHVSANGNHIRENADANTDALCALRTDLRIRHDSAADFLRTHTAGLVDRYGTVLISAEQLRESIRDQESTLSALHDLDCPVVP